MRSNALLKHDDQEDLDRKTKALMLLASTMPKGEEMAELFPRYLDLAEGVPTLHFEDACRRLAKIWDNQWTYPQPGEILKLARRISGDATRRRFELQSTAERQWDQMQSRGWWVCELRRILSHPAPTPQRFRDRRDRRIHIAECMIGIREFPSDDAHMQLMTRMRDWCFRDVPRGTYNPPIRQRSQ